ncbi:hypothetical protein Tco_0726460 [Tanacetum coccineum]|uniref:Uncharacterized protein n=1 Tax=Tanacetum coccineum TaxID=301880 RepID=A0ABQ4YFM9_9ASTR
MDELIRNRNAKFAAFQQDIDTLKETLSNQEHDVISVIDDEKTLILEEESRSKMLDKHNDPISIKQKINISPIDYSKLNKIKEDFGKRFVTKKELSAKQAFWLKHSNYNLNTSVKSHTPVRIEAPSELPMCSVEKNAFEIQIKQLSIDNDQLLKQIMSQEIVHIAVNSMDILNVNKSCMDECNKCLELETELPKKKDLIEKDIFDKLLKSYTTLEKLLWKNVIKKDIDEIETINIELEYSVAKLLFENENLRKEREHLKSIYKDQFDSIRKTRVQSKEHCSSLIAQMNAKSVEYSDLNAQLQQKVFAIAALKNELRKLRGKNVIDTVVSEPIATITTDMFKLDIKPISHRLKNNRDAYETDSLRTKDSNKPLLTSTGVNTNTSASGSKPSGSTKKNRISRPPSSNQKNKVEEHTRKFKSSLNKTNSISEPISNAHVKHSIRNAKFESICVICNKCLFDANHDMCVIDYVNNVNVHSKSKSKRNKKRKVWKPTGKVFTEIGYSWKPIGRIFTIVRNMCHLTRITSTKEVPLKESTITPIITTSLELKVNSRKPKASRSVGSSSKVKIV